MQRQPTDETCGPTCLHAVYRYWSQELELDEVVRSVRSLQHDGAGRGTIAVNLGADALRRGFRATLYTFNLNLFDPTWFDESGLLRPGIERKLMEQADAKDAGDLKFQAATRSYLEFVRLGGIIRLEDLTSDLISGHIRAGRPVLTGLSATYLYRASREYGPNDDEDDIRGEPQGHFVILHGYEPGPRTVHVADPLEDNPAFLSRSYTVPMSRIVPSILLGVLTYDANLLIIEPQNDAKPGLSAPRSPDDA
ncbi:MAG: hypothetical protein JJU44_11465 [Planctomycetes bacterium]|nr:hypothetical protein [Planctomycetota bacterium]